MNQFFSTLLWSRQQQEVGILSQPPTDGYKLQILDKQIDDFCTKDVGMEDSDLSDLDYDNIGEFQDSSPELPINESYLEDLEEEVTNSDSEDMEFKDSESSDDEYYSENEDIEDFLEVESGVFEYLSPYPIVIRDPGGLKTFVYSTTNPFPRIVLFVAPEYALLATETTRNLVQ